MGGKGRGISRSTLEEGHAQQDFGRGSAGGKGSTGMWNETQAKQQWLAGK